MQYHQVITDRDVLAISDGAGRLAAHGCATHNFIAGETKELGASDDPIRDVDKLVFHGYELLVMSYLPCGVYSDPSLCSG